MLDRLQIGLRYWALSLAVCVATLLALEGFFRSEILWRLPEGVVLAADNDLDIRSTWRSYQPPAPTDRHVLLLGGSTACASMELPGDGTSVLLSRAAGVSVEFRALCGARASFGDYLLFLENALAHGFRPDLVVAYTWPGMFTDERVAKAAAHTRYIPLISDTWLRQITRQGRTGYAPDSNAWLLRHSAVVRHRYYVNSWARRRLAAVLEGRFELSIAYDEAHYRRPRTRPLETDTDRFERTRALQTRFAPATASDGGFTTLLTLLERQQIPTLLVEAPWSPPVRTLLAGIERDYAAFVRRVAAHHQTTYLNPNVDVVLEPRHFADLYHASWDGRLRWLAPLVPALVEMLV